MGDVKTLKGMLNNPRQPPENLIPKLSQILENVDPAKKGELWNFLNTRFAAVLQTMKNGAQVSNEMTLGQKNTRETQILDNSSGQFNREALDNAVDVLSEVIEQNFDRVDSSEIHANLSSLSGQYLNTFEQMGQ